MTDSQYLEFIKGNPIKPANGDVGGFIGGLFGVKTTVTDNVYSVLDAKGGKAAKIAKGFVKFGSADTRGLFGADGMGPSDQRADLNIQINDKPNWQVFVEKYAIWLFVLIAVIVGAVSILRNTVSRKTVRSTRKRTTVNAVGRSAAKSTKTSSSLGKRPKAGTPAMKAYMKRMRNMKRK